MMKEEAVFKPYRPEGLETGKQYTLLCDDDGIIDDAWLKVIISEDGDVYLRMHDWDGINEELRNDEGIHASTFPGIRVRTLIGGGRNPRTRQALLWLAQAIRLDNIDNQRAD